jgi:hypothetical protein
MWWGVAAALLANTLYSVGFVLEKRALGALPEVSIRRPARLLGLVLRSPLWIGGSLALAAGFAAQLAVYRTLPIAAAQGIFVSGLVLLVLLSARLLGEETTGRERYALAAILLALLMVVLSLEEGADHVGRDAPYPLILLVQRRMSCSIPLPQAPCSPPSESHHSLTQRFWRSLLVQFPSSLPCFPQPHHSSPPP